MNLRTKLILNVCVFMLLVCGLLTVNIAIDAAGRAKAEERRNADFIRALATDWVQSAQELNQAPAWAVVERRLSNSALVQGWLIVGKRPVDDKSYTLAIECAQPAVTDLGAEEKWLREAIEKGGVTPVGGRIYTSIRATNDAVYAARFDLYQPYVGARTFVGGLASLVIVMAVGTGLLVLSSYVFLNRFVLRPLESLVEASHRISDGDFSKKVPERATYDEMATLINAFNLMIDRIGSHRAGLVDDVRRARERVTNTEKRLFAAQRLSTTGTLAAGIAHEINNPLGGMINAARTIRGGGLTDDKQKEYLELIVEGLERIRTIVQKVLQFRPKALEPQPVALREVIAKATSFMEHRAKHKGVDVRNELPADLPPVHGDPLELQQAFLNILMNAVDACIMNEGVVTVAHRLEGPWITVSIVDNGCGMDEKELAHCMDLFYTTKDVGEGTGLGLAVAQNIFHNHGGKIEIRSQKGNGTTVSVTLPAHRGTTQRLPAGGVGAPATAPPAPAQPAGK